MLNDADFGTRDKRGDWKPSKRLEYPPVFIWPMQGKKFLKWLFGFHGYFLPHNLFYAILSVVLWLYLIPSIDTMKTFSVSWISYLFVLNAAMVFIFYGAFHLKLYVVKSQGNSFKYNSRWLSTGNPVFLFRNQTIDNLIWTFASAVPIATAYQVLIGWLFANGYMRFVDLEAHPIYFVLLLIIVPVIHEIHFYIIHRVIHVPLMYHLVHKLHHNNVNPGPWSGLSMHPIEHLLYFSGVLIYCLIPSHPIHVLFHFLYALLSPAPSHVGFDKVVFGNNSALDTDCYAHYLHHKYFECNYTDGVIPLDKWFGTFHDGSPESQERMDKRLMERAQKRAEREAARSQNPK